MSETPSKAGFEQVLEELVQLRGEVARQKESKIEFNKVMEQMLKKQEERLLEEFKKERAIAKEEAQARETKLIEKQEKLASLVEQQKKEIGYLTRQGTISGDFLFH